MTRPTCSQLKTQLQEIKGLKAEFDLGLVKIKDTRNTAPALKLEEEIRGKIKDALFFAQFDHVEWVETTIGDKSKEELIKELEDREKSNNPEDKISIHDSARRMIEHPDFKIVNKPEKITLAKIKVKDLGFKERPTIDQIYQRAKELGLELCPPEIGPHLILNYQAVFKIEQPKDEWLYMGMKPITGSSGAPYVFSVGRNGAGERFLTDDWARPDGYWNPGDEFIFIRK